MPSGAPFHCAMDAWTKPVPVSERVKVGSPTFADTGVMLVSAGGAGLMVRVTAFDCGPPEPPIVTCAVPGCAIRLAGTDTVSCVALTKVVGRGILFTKANATNPFSLTVSVKSGPPTVTLEGEMLVITGAGATVKNSGLDGALPGFVTVTDSPPTCRIRFAGTAAVSCVLLTNVVVSDAVPRETVAPDTKLAPITVRVKDPLPAVTIDGKMLVMVAVGAVVVRLTALEAAPPGFAAVIFAVPGCAMRLAGTTATSWVVLTKFVVNAVLLNDTVAPARKFVPVTVKSSAGPPAITVDGEMLVMVGVGGVIVRLTALDGAPPVFVAVICAVPGCAMRLAGTAAVS